LDAELNQARLDGEPHNSFGLFSAAGVVNARNEFPKRQGFLPAIGFHGLVSFRNPEYGRRFGTKPGVSGKGMPTIPLKFCPAKARQPEQPEPSPVRRSGNNPNSGCAARLGVRRATSERAKPLKQFQP
jgi:hypothetical protein